VLYRFANANSPTMRVCQNRRMTVDEFVQKKVPAQYRDLVAELRVLLRQNMPGVEELISYGIPMYRYDKPIAWITPSKSGVTLGFRDGASIEDKFGLLKGKGKGARNVHIKTVEDVNKAALRDYIKQAVKLDRSANRGAVAARARAAGSKGTARRPR